MFSFLIWKLLLYIDGTRTHLRVARSFAAFGVSYAPVSLNCSTMFPPGLIYMCIFVWHRKTNEEPKILNKCCQVDFVQEFLPGYEAIAKGALAVDVLGAGPSHGVHV